MEIGITPMCRPCVDLIKLDIRQSYSTSLVPTCSKAQEQRGGQLLSKLLEKGISGEGDKCKALTPTTLNKQ